VKGKILHRNLSDIAAYFSLRQPLGASNALACGRRIVNGFTLPSGRHCAANIPRRKV
jgi:hypothetical protein